MSEYIFYTAEGFTQDPNGDDMENCQVLGRAFGENAEIARDNLLRENPWIQEHGFDVAKIRCERLATCQN